MLLTPLPPPPKADADQKWKQIPLQRRYSTRLCNGEEQRLGEGAEEREVKRLLRSENNQREKAS